MSPRGRDAAGIAFFVLLMWLMRRPWGRSTATYEPLGPVE